MKLRPINPKVLLTLFFLLTATTTLSCAASSLLDFRKNQNSSELNLDHIADHSTQAFEANMSIYSHILYGGRGLLYSSQEVSRKEFNTFVSSLDLPRKAPGVSGMFYLKLVNDEQKTRFVSQQQTNNDLDLVDTSDFNIWPQAQKSRYLVATYSEPSNMSDIRKSLGFDFSSELVRLAAFEQATQDNKATMTKPLVAAVNKAQIFVMVLPIYNQTQPIITPQERLAAVNGAVTLSFRSERLFNSAFELFLDQNPDLQIVVYDGENVTPEALLYDSNISKEVLGATTTLSATQTEVRVVEAGNRTWTITYTQPKINLTSSLFLTSLLIANLVVGLVSMILAWRTFDQYRHSKS